MPAVDVYHGYRFMNDSVAPPIKDAVRSFGSKVFSTNDISLTENDFSFKFHTAGKFDELTNDIIVRIRLHSDEERIATVDNSIAANLAEYIALQLFPIFTEKGLPTVGVELSFTPIAWGTNV